MEVKIGNVTVRIHGTVDHDKLKEASVEFLKRIEAQRKEGGLVRGGAAAKTHKQLCGDGA